LPRGPSFGGSCGPFLIGRMSPEAVALKYARVEPPPRIKNLSNNPLFVNGAANVSKNLLCNAKFISTNERSSLCIFNQRNQLIWYEKIKHLATIKQFVTALNTRIYYSLIHILNVSFEIFVCLIFCHFRIKYQLRTNYIFIQIYTYLL